MSLKNDTLNYRLGYSSFMNVKGILKDILSTILIVLIIVGIGIAITGTWPFMVAVQSGSMEPNLHKGDVVFLISSDRVRIITWAEGKEIGYKSFGDYGDVIVYYPNGDRTKTPIIHRAIAYIRAGDRIPILHNGSLLPSKFIAKSDGYITQGDHNSIPDQLAPNWRIEPVKKEWIIGVAKFRIPYVGWIRILI